MSVATTVRSVADALQDASRWRADEESRHKAQLVEIDQQLGELRQALVGLQEKIASLEQFREGLGDKSAELESGEVRRAHDGLFEALAEQAAALEQRTAQLREAEAKRLSMLDQVLAEGDLAQQVKEYTQFKEAVEPALSAMPESYRSVVLGHHQKVVQALRERITELLSDPIHAEGEPLSLEVAFAVDAPEDQPELLVVVTPVSAEVAEGWAERPEDLQSRLAARVVQAIYEACHEVGLETVQVASGGHRGLLAIEADVTGAPLALGASLEKRLRRVLSSALELAAAKVRIEACAVHADHILGLEEESDVD